MTVIRISERAGVLASGNAVVTFDAQAEYPVSVTSPFSPQEERHLEWYFERHLRFPFVDQVKAAAAARSIVSYGESLFSQVFADHRARGRYSIALQSGVSRLRFEIAGSPEFHALHWEAMKDPDLPRAFSLEAPMVRKNLVPQVISATVQPSPTINLLLVVARSGERSDVGYRTISRPLVDALGRAETRVRVEILRPGTYRALSDCLQAKTDKHGPGYYHVIHFDLHGSLLTYDELQKGVRANRYLFRTRYGRGQIAPYEGLKAFLSFASETEGSTDPVESSELATLLMTHGVPVAILNACQSGKQVGATETSLGSRLMQSGVQTALAMGYSVTVSAGEILVKSLYEQLFLGAELAVAIRRGRLELFNQRGRRAYFDQVVDLEDWILPVVYENQQLQLTVRELTADEAKEFYQDIADQFPFPEPSYGFFGRDLDILRIETRLLSRGNVLLVRGMGGAGKTTLLRHVAAWWQRTQFVDEVFYFGYDDRAWNLQQILVNIAERVLSRVEHVAKFEPLGVDGQRAMLATILKAQPHLLILDNLESITSTGLAIPNRLGPDEREKVRVFLAALRGGKTRVLCGSRGGEEWLAPQTFGDNIYDLPGLDPEAASSLADRVLEHHGATQYRETDEFQHLLKLLGGYPTPIKVVLANLAAQTPQQVLKALQAGRVDLDHGTVQDKTQSILRCIDYSFGNLSPGAQDLLCSLAYFTGICRDEMLMNYLPVLRAQPALATLPFDTFTAVLDEAKHWGLVSPHVQLRDALVLQPMLPFFLRTRLNAPERAGLKEAIRTAFRTVYKGFCTWLIDPLRSKDPSERRAAVALTSWESENISTALDMNLEVHASLDAMFASLSLYLDAQEDNEQGYRLAQKVLNGLSTYPPEILAGEVGTNMVLVLHDIGGRLLLLNRLGQARRAVQNALRIYKAHAAFRRDDWSDLIGPLHQLLGSIEQRLGRLDHAERCFKRALRVYRRREAKNAEAEVYYDLGSLEAARGDLDRSVRYHSHAIRMFREVPNDLMVGRGYLSLGATRSRREEWEKADRCLRRARRILAEVHDFHSMNRAIINLARVAANQNRWKVGKRRYRKALALAIDLSDRSAQAVCFQGLGEISRLHEGRPDQALAYYSNGIQQALAARDRAVFADIAHSIFLLRDSLDEQKLKRTLRELLSLTEEQVEDIWRTFAGGAEKLEAPGPSSDPEPDS